MNLWLRIFWYLLAAPWRTHMALPQERSILHFRVWPTDLDTSLHMNNGRYLTVMDLGRLDLMVTGGLWRAVVRHRWTPIANAIKIRFRREMRLFQRFRLETRLVAWDRTTVVIEQTFVLVGGTRDGQIAAQALFKGGIYDRRKSRFVPIAELMRLIGVHADSPLPQPEVEAFLKADEELKLAAKRRQ
ncbi:MAG: thioesterase family protein [Hyphomicrobiaceae bacterium]|nr:thioesterase family protein [Hyphomicrobiaceae bacterium]